MATQDEHDDDLAGIPDDELNRIQRFHIESGRRIEALMDEQELTLVEVAEQLGIVPNYLGNIRRGKKTPAVIRHYAKLAEILGTTTDYLMAVPWSNNSSRNPQQRLSEEALRAAAIIDKLPESARQSLLVVMDQYARVLGALIDRERALLRYRLADAEAGKVDLDSIRIDDMTLNDFIASVFAKDGSN